MVQSPYCFWRVPEFTSHHPYKTVTPASGALVAPFSFHGTCRSIACPHTETRIIQNKLNLYKTSHVLTRRRFIIIYERLFWTLRTCSIFWLCHGNLNGKEQLILQLSLRLCCISFPDPQKFNHMSKIFKNFLLPSCTTAHCPV